MTPDALSQQGIPAVAKKPPPWRRYFVGVDGGASAGNCSRRTALFYAECQASYGRTAVVMKMQRNGSMREITTILGEDNHA